MGITLKKNLLGAQIFFSAGPQIPLSTLENSKCEKPVHLFGVLLKINDIYLYRKDIFLNTRATYHSVPILSQVLIATTDFSINMLQCGAFA